ncbi:unnamed protein product, partial [Staurois parvus]
MGDTERQLRWALICGIDVHWYALICGIDVALMGTGTWHCWGYTDHQGTLTVTARGKYCRKPAIVRGRIGTDHQG